MEYYFCNRSIECFENSCEIDGIFGILITGKPAEVFYEFFVLCCVTEVFFRCLFVNFSIETIIPTQVFLLSSSCNYYFADRSKLVAFISLLLHIFQASTLCIIIDNELVLYSLMQNGGGWGAGYGWRLRCSF